MKEELTAVVSEQIGATRMDVWDALTNPEKIKQYLFGTHTECDWKVGSRITYSGEWQGTHYEDKGEILEVVVPERLVMTYWSSFSGIADIPENYQKITYLLEEAGDGTKLTVIQENHRSRETRDHSAENWKGALAGLKKVAEARESARAQ